MPGDDNNTRGRAFLFERDQVGIGMKSKVFTLKTDLWAIDMGSLLKLGLLYLLEHPEEMTVEVIPVECMHMIILTE